MHAYKILSHLVPLLMMAWRPKPVNNLDKNKILSLNHLVNFSLRRYGGIFACVNVQVLVSSIRITGKRFGLTHFVTISPVLLD